MTPERWKQVSQIYEGARIRPAAGRAVYLAEVCADDEALRREVQALLDQPTSPSLLEGLTPAGVAQAMDDEAGSGLSGTRFGVYLVHELIGKGGMGEVYRARDTRLGRDVAIKVLPRAFAADADQLARFEREARLLAALDHPNVGAIHGIEESDPSTSSGQAAKALVLALVEGDTLAERIARGPLSIADALEYAKQIADALEAAHEKGIVHRDLKPGNIKLKPRGAPPPRGKDGGLERRLSAADVADCTVKVLDFGLAKLWSGEAAEGHLTHSPTMSAGTKLGTILGTAAYMSPEQARGKPVDKRTDIWAFGCVLFEMLTGRRAFEGQDVAEVLAGIIDREPDWNSLPAATPPAIRRLLRRSLAKDQRRRLSDIADARLEIDEAIAPPVAPVASGDVRARAGAWTTAVVVGAALIAVLLAGFAALNSRRVEPDLAVTQFEIDTPPTFDSVAVALSPDGRQLVFIANEDGQQKLWIRPLDRTEAQPLAATEGASFPFWAPDSRQIGFFADGKLKTLGLGGGRPLVLADAPLALGGSWGPDGTILFAPADRVTSKLMRVAAAGGVPVPVPGTEFGSPRLPEFLPDGRHFLVQMRWTLGGERDGAYFGSLDTPELRRLPAIDTAAVYARPGYLLFVRQGALMAVSFDASTGIVSGEPVPVAPGVNSNTGRRGAFSVSSNGLLAYRVGIARGRQLVWFDRKGRIAGTMGPPAEPGRALASPELAPNGRQVAIPQVVQGDSDVYLLDAPAAGWTRFTFDPSSDNYPVWAPDGSRLVFTSTRGDPNREFTKFFEKSADGSRDERLLFTAPDSHRVWPADWSPDGRFLLYHNQDPKTGIDLWALPLTGERPSTGSGRPELAEGRTPFPVVQTPFFEDKGQFSPDGKWIAYQSNQSGRDEIYVQAFPGPAGSQLVSTEGGSQPRWRRDGTELFYVAANNMLMVVAIGPVVGQRLETSKPVPLFRTRLEGTDQPKQQYAVSPDGQRFLMNVIADEANVPPITIV